MRRIQQENEEISETDSEKRVHKPASHQSSAHVINAEISDLDALTESEPEQTSPSITANTEEVSSPTATPPKPQVDKGKQKEAVVTSPLQADTQPATLDGRDSDGLLKYIAEKGIGAEVPKSASCLSFMH